MQGEGGRNVGNLRLGAKEGPINDDPINQLTIPSIRNDPEKQNPGKWQIPPGAGSGTPPEIPPRGPGNPGFIPWE